MRAAFPLALRLLLAVCPSALAAEGTARHAWGLPAEGSAPSAVAVEPCDRPCVAVVRFDNTLVTFGAASGADARPSVHPPVRATLAMAGVALAVTVEHGAGMAPDRLRVRPPPGYAAEPDGLLVADGAIGRVRVLPVPTS